MKSYHISDCKVENVREEDGYLLADISFPQEVLTPNASLNLTLPPPKEYLTFYKYFPYEEIYPFTQGPKEILPLGTLYNYVSSTFLNGIVNYSEPLKAFLMERYTKWDKVLDNGLTKEQNFASCLKNNDVNLGSLKDDVVILSRAKNGIYTYFWFDCDVSDCFVGRFETEDPQDAVISLFDKLVNDYEQDEKGTAKEIPVRWLKGDWIRF
jgi:hypothetical protein